MKENVKKINDKNGVADTTYNEDTKEYDLNNNYYDTLEFAYELYNPDDNDFDNFYFDSFYEDKRNQKTLNVIREYEKEDEETFNELVVYYFDNILIRARPFRAFHVLGNIKQMIETGLDMRLNEFEKKFLVEFIGNKAVNYPLSEIEKSFNIKNKTLYYKKEYLFREELPPVIKQIGNDEEFKKSLNQILEKYNVKVELIKAKKDKSEC